MFVMFFFIVYFVTGIFIVDDYGISWDEDLQRLIAQDRFDYILFFFSNFFGELLIIFFFLLASVTSLVPL